MKCRNKRKTLNERRERNEVERKNKNYARNKEQLEWMIERKNMKWKENER